MENLNSIIDVLDRFASCSTALERWRTLGALMERCGSDWITLGTASSDCLDQPDIRSSTPEALMADYMNEKIYREDPWMRLCAKDQGVDLLEVPSALSGTMATPVTRRMCEIFHGYGIETVALVPMRPGPHCGGVVLYARNGGASARMVSEHGLAEVRLIAALFAATWRPEADLGEGRGYYSARQRLAPREAEALRWLAAGMKTSRIADRMGIQDVTVSKHIASARRKLGARTREQALAIALARGLIAA